MNATPQKISLRHNLLDSIIWFEGRKYQVVSFSYFDFDTKTGHLLLEFRDQHGDIHYLKTSHENGYLICQGTWYPLRSLAEYFN